MNEKANQLGREVQDGLTELWDKKMSALISEAKEEALAEAKAMLKHVMVWAILEDILEERWSERSPRNLQGHTTKPSAATKTARRAANREDTAPLDRQAIRREIEDIKRSVADNERLLGQTEEPPISVDEVNNHTIEEPLSVPGDEPGEGYYVYGIVQNDNCAPVGELPQQGVDPAYPVYSLRYEDIGAIVSRVSLEEFSQEAIQANLRDMKWLEAGVAAHQRTLDAVSACRSVIPMKFCTIYQSKDAILQMMARHYPEFADDLARLKGKEEWGVKVYCDSRVLSERIAAGSERVKKLEAEAREKPRGVAYFLKKKVDETVADEAERATDECAQHSHQRLSRLAEEAVMNPLQDKEATGRGEEMVLNGVFLVDKEKVEAFRAEAGSLGEEYGDLGFSYETTGPWQPYNFITVGAESEGKK